jgi:lia operon protein LiaF
MRPGQVVGPLILIGFGVLFLLSNLGWDFPIGYMISTYWPVIIIAVGLVHTAGALAGRGNLAGGIIVTTVGALFLMHQLWDIRFGNTWPVLLIVIGGIGLLRALLGPSLFEQRYMRGGVRR